MVTQKKIKVFIILFMIYIILQIFSAQNIVLGDTKLYYNADYLKRYLQVGESALIRWDTYATLQSDGTYTTHSVETLLDNVRLTKYKAFIKCEGSETNPFPSNQVNGLVSEYFIDEAGIFSDKTSIYKKVNLEDKDRINESNPRKNSVRFSITLYDGVTITFVSPASHYESTVYREQTKVYETIIKDKSEAINDKSLTSEIAKNNYAVDSIVITNTQSFLSNVEKAVKDGLIAGSIETGYNVGTVYSTEQKPLVDVMEELGRSTEGSSENNNVENIIKTGLYEFNNSKSLTATLDYFFSPLFGKMEVNNAFPKTSDGWGVSKYYNLIDISNKELKINEEFKNFCNPNSPDRVGLYPVKASLNYVNGVKAYSKGSSVLTSTNEPEKLIDYSMRVAVPYLFTHTGANNAYSLASGGLQIIEGIRMSLYNDTIYKEVVENGVKKRVKLCTNKDLELQREYLALFHQKINNETVGVVIVLKFNEAVVNTKGSPIDSTNVNDTNNAFKNRVYLTGRKIFFNNNYTDKLILDNENKDVMSYSTAKSNNIGIKARNFAFQSTGTPTPLYLTVKENHQIINNSENISFLASFIGETSSTESNNNTVYGFVLFRNNTYIKETALLNWLTTNEAKSLLYVKTDELRKLIKGEFGVSELSFSEWLEMERIKKELGYEKENIIYSIINVVCIIVGSFFIIFAMLFIFAYWFDIFNTFTGISILYIISGRNMYPIASKDMIELINQEKSATKYVTFKDVLKISIICCFVGVFFLRASSILSFIISIYTYLMKLLG